ncbi:MAG: HpcH/HpaI aldolase/citrate lyase family protein [Selenomonadaceae bacterium]|nr:HpcH/HpaI aldolase/citrate lyase family protein [Selenomonadaceae bacterium]
MVDKEILQYKVGGLMYMPAFQKNIVGKLSGNKLPYLNSAAFCLEDSISDESVDEAEATLKIILRELESVENLPLIFVRIRSPRHLQIFHETIGMHSKILTGYILPKVDMNNAFAYINVAKEINEGRLSNPIYIMPTFESKRIAILLTRQTELLSLKQAFDEIKQIILNIRVGANDLCNLYGLRRNINQTIYDIGVVRDIFVDIINVFATDYVVAGSVWNYFGGDNDNAWAEGLRRELELDKANGFTGKTAIHPSQLPIIFNSMKVTKTDWDDANMLLDWKSSTHGVTKSADGSRMNEVKCHSAWARKIKILGELYGVIE